MLLSVVLIVKDEEAILEKCLNSIKDSDEIIIVDTGSCDKTIEIAKKFTDKIYHFKWVDDFSKARNFALSKATGDWIFSIDADHQLITPIKKVKEIIKKAKGRALSLKSNTGKHWHWRKVIFKRDKDIFWEGKVHENLNIKDDEHTEIERFCGYSVNHKKDPERNLKILLSMDKTPRTLFYTAREYFDLKMLEKSLETFNEYLKVAFWLPEIVEAQYLKAVCYWRLGRGNEARTACLEAIRNNPDCKKTLLLMSKIHFEPWKSKWKFIADNATNKDVLFK